MPLSGLLLQLARFLLPPALIGTIYLFTFPFLQNCGFPPARPAEAACHFSNEPRPGVAAELAPFRLLALGDPQLEGDTSLPDPNAPTFPSLTHLWNEVQHGGFAALTTSIGPAGLSLLTEDIPTNFQAYRKRLDLWGNDLYLAHVYALVKWQSDPTHVVVLGDLLGSQWIDDEEFDHRSKRFWNRVFKGGQKVPKEIMETSGRQPEVLGQDTQWKNRIIAVAGNHDVGYAGDVTKHRIERFEKSFGNVNWEVRFKINGTETPTLGAFGGVSSPQLRLVILNSMNLDGPAADEEMQQLSHDFLMNEIAWRKDLPTTTATLLLTHIPLYKQEGVCVDGPLFHYWPDEDGGGLREQNHLDQAVSDFILDGLVGPQRKHQAVIMNGHDHEGCLVYHWRNQSDSDTADDRGRAWRANNFYISRAEQQDESLAGIREITVRSMMGNFGGNVGFLSAWWDTDSKRWRFEYSACMFGVQHVWWAIYVVDLVVAGLALGGVLCAIWEQSRAGRAQKVKTA